MGQQYLGEIRLLSFQFAPKGWAQCAGQLLSIQQNTALFSLLGTFFGGNGVSNFALPDLRGRAPLHMGQPLGRPFYTFGQPGGTENVTLLQTQIPTHNHFVMAVNAVGTSDRPLPNGLLAQSVGTSTQFQYGYGPATNTTTLTPASIQPAGNTIPHNNMQPYLVMNYCIALQGIYPSRS